MVIKNDQLMKEHQRIKDTKKRIRRDPKESDPTLPSLDDILPDREAQPEPATPPLKRDIPRLKDATQTTPGTGARHIPFSLPARPDFDFGRVSYTPDSPPSLDRFMNALTVANARDDKKFTKFGGYPDDRETATGANPKYVDATISGLSLIGQALAGLSGHEGSQKAADTVAEFGQAAIQRPALDLLQQGKFLDQMPVGLTSENAKALAEGSAKNRQAEIDREDQRETRNLEGLFRLMGLEQGNAQIAMDADRLGVTVQELNQQAQKDEISAGQTQQGLALKAKEGVTLPGTSGTTSSDMSTLEVVTKMAEVVRQYRDQAEATGNEADIRAADELEEMHNRMVRGLMFQYLAPQE